VRRGGVLCAAAALVLATAAYADPPAPGPSAPLPPGPPAPPASGPPPQFDATPPVLDRMSFDEAVRRALARNPSMATAEAEVRRARAILEETRSSALPTLSVNATYTRLDADRVLNGRVIAGANQISANVSLTVPLVVPSRWAAWSHASENVRVAEIARADVRRTVAANVAHAYITVSSEHRIIATLERARDNARTHYDYAHTRFSAGVGSRIDEVRAAQEITLDEGLVANARLNLARQQLALGVLMGLDHPVDAVDDANVADAPDRAHAIAEADRRRADVAVGQRRLRAAERVRDDSWLDFLPTLFGTFQPFYQNPPTLTNPEWGWQAQVILSVPLYDGGLRYGLRHEREVAVDEARIALDALRTQVRAEITAAYEQLRQAEAAAAAARESVRLAEDVVALADQAYRAGATSNLELVDAQRRARDLRASANAADDNVRQARLDLLLAAGAFP
jgi:outer membrane protein TolC